MWSPTWQLNFAQNRPFPILIKSIPDATNDMGSIMAKFHNSFSSSLYFFLNTKKSAKIAPKSIFREKIRAVKMDEDDENEF
ncbi:hypothetical protein B9Z55_023100 [Caenorhabditis nigoni]|uniref:Uncharacterized protein n=1 Tax=Caenorhabditis nigoni TaxID=1611254 RepID=A0A2G5SNJ2_9PELO|nr:hypothetical protein B9Z55_023100 [Caenorhabditis nigoni]